MPAYDFKCPVCGWSGTRFNVSIDRRDQQCCEYCLAKLAREEISETLIGKDVFGFSPGMKVGTDGRTLVSRRRKPASIRKA